MTLQEYFFWEYYSGGPDSPKIDYALRASVQPTGEVDLYIHPAGRDGSTTPTLKVQGNSVVWPKEQDHGCREL